VYSSVGSPGFSSLAVGSVCFVPLVYFLFEEFEFDKALKQVSQGLHTAAHPPTHPPIPSPFSQQLPNLIRPELVEELVMISSPDCLLLQHPLLIKMIRLLLSFSKPR
jgi:hypothetical protein